ncbi:response regulator transcription factor [Mesorhizobium sp. M3A.F.Ca.ET.080.04.2.1]|uniref:response regulator transcription factor n=1 Tax=Mesorhizobium sp. M3A.F.Ca.ET.080.04.2.1 TaxID=2493676 RepID=UPI000F753F20|nr:response regulator transcription factor [Mesorhizobium sp. M3A.F.Ca.ET.080.04.2.1]AZO12018.1 response regulator transcription factor [Mesorhizobium sp. M3A.F.Ca.ET.080.04.2.1]
MRILFVEDSVDQATAVIGRLRRSGYAVDWAKDGESANQLFQEGVYDLVLLDLILPKVDGEIFLGRLRARKATVPVLVMTARGGLEEKVRVLDIGADDYVVKPFELTEIEARIRALLLRPHGHASSTITIANLTFDLARRRVEIDGHHVPLGQREFRLLELFLGKLDHLLTKDAILDHLFAFDEPAAPNAVELYVSRLRKKLAGTQVDIRTVWGEGYVAEHKKRQ